MPDQVSIYDKLKSFALHHCPVLTANKDDYLLRAGEVEQKIYFVASGAVMAGLVGEEEEHIIRFGYSGSIINSLASFYQQQPSDMYLQAIRKTHYHSINQSDFRRIVGENELSVQSYCQMLEMLVVQQMEREVDLLVASPKDRIMRVMKRSPQLFQEVPHKYIAIYLRMTAETFSRTLKSCV